MGLAVHLLGHPTVEGGGRAAPRGRKAWALLAYLLAGEVPPTRSHLAGLLFSGAEDPLRSLRWHLTELRRVLNLSPERLGGDPVRVRLPEDAMVDMAMVRSGDALAARGIPGLGRELLEGMDFSDSPAFEVWLLIERRHLRAASAALLREAALSLLAAGDAPAAVGLAGRLVSSEPTDEEGRALLRRCLDAEGGDGGTDDATALRPGDLAGTPPPPSSSDRDGRAGRHPAAGRALARAQVEAGKAAVAGGALERGLTCLRRAAVEAARCDSAELEAAALESLGSALVHAGRGSDEEGSWALHRAIAVSRARGRPDLAATAHWELGYVDFLRGRYTRAEHWLGSAEQLAGRGGPARSHVLGVRGACLADTGRYAVAEELLQQSIELGWLHGEAYRTAWSLTFLGRNHLLCGRLGDAATALDRAIDITTTERLTNLVPWPESFRSELDLLLGDLDASEERAEHAFALGCELANPCWEAIAGRSVALHHAARGDLARALATLDDACQRFARLPGAYLWVLGHLLDARCELLVGQRAPEAEAATVELEQLAAPAGMRELLLRAYLHRARLGAPAAAQVARVLAPSIDNPTLQTTADGDAGLRAGHGGRRPAARPHE